MLWTLGAILVVFATSASLSGTGDAAVTESQAEAEPTALTGRVVGADGQPLADATVRLKPRPAGDEPSDVEPTPLVVRTGPDGWFSSGDLTGRRFDVRVHGDGHAFRTARDQDASQPLKVKLERGHPIRGRVVAAENGLAIAGARVRLDDDEAFDLGGVELETITDDEGRYEFPHAPAGTVWVRSTADGRASRSVRGRVPAKSGPRSAIILDDHWLPEAGRVSGRVVDAEGEPVPDASVVIFPMDGVVAKHRDRFRAERSSVDKKGRFAVDGITAGTRYRLVASAPRLARGAAGPFFIDAGTELDDVTVTLRAGATLRLRLTDAEDRPLTEMKLYLDSEEDVPASPLARYRVVDTKRGDVEISDEGWLEFPRLPGGSFSLRLEPDGWSDLRRTGVVLTEGETTNLGTLNVEPGLRLRGRIVDGGSEPVAGARVSAQWRDLRGNYARESVSDSAGEFSIGGLPDFALTLEVSGDGFALQTVPEVQCGDEALVVRLELHGGLRGRVLLAGGGTPVSFSAQAVPGRGSKKPPLQFDNGDGWFEIGELDPGTYSVEIRSPGRSPGRARGIKVRGGEVIDAGKITLDSGLALGGRVIRDNGGTAVPGVRVRVDRGAGPVSWDRESGDAATRADANGRFAFDGLERGRYTLTLDHEEFAPFQQSVDLDPEVDARDLEIRLTSGGEIHGTVTDSDGLPVGGADIFIIRGTRGFDRRIVVTLDDGSFRIEKLAPGTYLLWWTRSRARQLFNSQTKTVKVREGQSTLVEFSE